MIFELNTKSDLEELFQGNESGIIRKYILKDSFDNKLDKIVYASSELIEDFQIYPYIEVKYTFGRRNKRLDIVYCNSSEWTICKLTNETEFDKDYYDLITVIEDIKVKHQDITINGFLIFLSDYNEDIVEDFLKKQKVHLSHKRYLIK